MRNISEVSKLDAPTAINFLICDSCPSKLKDYEVGTDLISGIGLRGNG